jgi:hypothetical protein
MDQGYKMVAERHARFVEEHPNGVVINNLRAHAVHPDGTGYVVMETQVWKERADADAGKMPDGVGHAGMPIPGPTNFTRNSEVENAETSSLGRALAMIGYHAKETMASEDEIQAKGGSSAPAPTRRGAAPKVVAPPDPEKVSAADRAMLMNWGKKVFGNRDAFLIFLDSEFDIKSGKDIRPDQLGDIKKAIAIHGAAAGQAIPEGVEFDA